MALTFNGSSNTIGGLAVGGVPDGTIDKDALATEAAGGTKLGNGGVIQVLSSTKSSAETFTNYNSNTTNDFNDFGSDLTGTDQAGSGSVWCVKITPTNASNKILVIYDIAFHADGRYGGMHIQRKIGSGATASVAVGDTVGSNRIKCTKMDGSHNNNHNYNGHMSPTNLMGTYLDSPNTTDEIIYKVQTGYTNGQWDYRVNTSEQGESQDDFHCGTAISTLTVMEIVA